MIVGLSSEHFAGIYTGNDIRVRPIIRQMFRGNGLMARVFIDRNYIIMSNLDISDHSHFINIRYITYTYFPM